MDHPSGSTATGEHRPGGGTPGTRPRPVAP